MALTAGTRLGPYQIEAPIGAGGMGEVYKARDSRLNRTVAIKVLPPQFAQDAEMRQRFDREAQTVAGLNHPHICTLHDVGEEQGTSFLVMEYLEGETLADRVARGPLPADEAVRIGIEIADALDKAHREGVVHRDLKPANVMLAKGETTRSAMSQTKLLDFGLAKWAAAADIGSHSTLPTRVDMTTPGTMLGTVQYMAPEQVEGRDADARTDVFAFGAVLYEMLTGKKAFEGKSQASLLGAIMKADPRPLALVQPQTPAILQHVVARCLAKDPDDRWQDAHSLLIELEWIARTRAGLGEAVVTRRWTWPRVAAAAAVVVLAVGLSVPAFLYLRGSSEPEAVQFRHTVTGISQSDIAISPDGRSVVFAAKPDTQGATSLYIRGVGAITSRKLEGTDNASQPFWSPDSRFIAYVANGKLKKVQEAGGAPQDLADAADFAGGSWSRAGTIVFGSTKGLFAVSAEGGKPAPISTLAQGDAGHFWPDVLPDGRHVVYLAWSENAASRAIYLGAIDSKETTRLIMAESNAVYAPGYLFFHRQATLFAQPFNAGRPALAPGDPIHVADSVASDARVRGHFGLSQNGVLFYFQGAGGVGTTGRAAVPGAGAQFGWRDRTGGRSAPALDVGPYGDMDLSPDGKLIAITKQEAGTPADIWVIDWEKNVSHRVTTDPVDAVDPVWSPDGTRIAFTSWRKGSADIYVKNANSVGDDTPLLQSSANESVEDWSKDGKYLALEFGQDNYQDIYAVELVDGKPGKPFPVVQGRYQKNEAQFSYDGKWLAYVSDENESGKFQVYVISFPSGGLKQQISTDGGGQPRWSSDGRELYYRTLTDFMVVDLKIGARIEPSAPRSMFGAPMTGAGTMTVPTRHQWSMTRDGRMLLRVPVGSASSTAATWAVVTPVFTPAGQAAAATAGTRGAISSGLTVVQHWASWLPKAGK